MKIDSDAKMLCFLFIFLGILLITLFVAFLDGIACTKCREIKPKSQILLFHAILNKKQELTIPYCPKCYVEVMDSPDLTWAGDE